MPHALCPKLTTGYLDSLASARQARSHFNNIKTREQWYRSCIMLGGLLTLGSSVLKGNNNKMNYRQVKKVRLSIRG